MKKIIVASNNNAKIAEIQEILSDFNLVSMKVENIDIEVLEDEETFAKNAIKKASKIAQKANEMQKEKVFCLADDSGIEIDCLNGFPGVKTKRWLDGTDRERNLKILEMLKDVPKEKRKIKFTTVIAISDGEKSIYAEGIINGYVSKEVRGENGFGFDEIFELENGKTLAELTAEQKNKISARKIALEQIKLELKKLYE